MENITIPMEEYKELLIIKGKYEELKSLQTRDSQVKPVLIKEPSLTRDYEPTIVPPYKVTCSETKRLIE